MYIYNDNNDKNDFNDIMIVWISHYIPTDKKDLNGAISWEHVMGHNGNIPQGYDHDIARITIIFKDWIAILPVGSKKLLPSGYD